MSETGSCGIYIPAHVKDCPGLTPTAWVVLGQILQLSDEKRGCYASGRTLAAALRMDRRTLFRNLRELRERGLVRRDRGGLWVAPKTDPLWTADPAEAVRPEPPEPTERPGRPGRPGRPEGRPRQARQPRQAQFLESHGSSPPACRTRATTPLEEKLLDVSGLRNLVGTKVFPGGRFGKCLSALKELNATPEELDRYVVWWREQAMSFRRDFPSLEQISGTLHQSRLAAQGRPGPGAAAARTSSARRVDPGAWALTNPEEFNRKHQLTPEQIAENHRFLAWKNLGKPIMEAIELARQGLSPPEAETDNAEC